MNALELYEQGRLSEAITAQQEELARTPDDHTARTFLAMLFLFAGEFDLATDAIEPIPTDARWEKDKRTFSELIASERKRWHAFDESIFPASDTEIPEHLHQRWKAMMSLFDSTPDNVIDCIDQADAFCPNLHGHVDGREFVGFRDADDFFASVIEVFEGGNYYWLAPEQVKRIQFPDMEGLREDLYREAILTRTDGRESRVFLPVLYFGSHLAEEEAIRMGLETDFFAIADGPLRGIGRRILLLGQEELTLPDCKQIDIRGMVV